MYTAAARQPPWHRSYRFSAAGSASARCSADMDGATGTTAGPMAPPVTRTGWWRPERPGRRSPQQSPQQPASQPPAWAIRPAASQPSPSERRPRFRPLVYLRPPAAVNRQLPQRRCTPTHAAVHGPQRSRRPAAASQKWLPAPVVHRQVRFTELPHPGRVTCIPPAYDRHLPCKGLQHTQERMAMLYSFMLQWRIQLQQGIHSANITTQHFHE